MPLGVVLGHADFHPSRVELLPRILDSWEGGVRQVVTDSERRGAWFTIRACWHEALRLTGGEGHLCAAQDDYLVARGGFERMQALCDANSERVLCFRWAAENEGWLHQWCERDDAFWCFSSHMWTGGAAAVPAPIVEDFLGWSRHLDANLRRPWRGGDDSRFELYCMAHDIEIVRCRWSLLRHLGKYSVVRSAERDGDDDELALVTDVDQLPPLDDPRWVVSEDVPSAVYPPEGFKRLVEVLLGRNAHKVGLGHMLREHVG